MTYQYLSINYIIVTVSGRKITILYRAESDVYDGVYISIILILISQNCHYKPCMSVFVFRYYEIAIDN